MYDSHRFVFATDLVHSVALVLDDYGRFPLGTSPIISRPDILVHRKALSFALPFFGLLDRLGLDEWEQLRRVAI
jgi:hypothetical protein